MGVGLGIHGEPGIAEAGLAPRRRPGPPPGRRRARRGARRRHHRVGVILNGLGATKYEELFVVWRTVARLLRDAGYTLVDPGGR